MKILIIALISISSVLGLESQCESSLGISIPNSHQVAQNIYRGNAPRNEEDIQALKKLGIETIYIFKNQTNTEVDDEIAKLLAAGYSNESILQDDFLWHDFKSHAQACKMVIKGLKLLSELRSEGKNVFFHCTVGEDRTG